MAKASAGTVSSRHFVKWSHTDECLEASGNTINYQGPNDRERRNSNKTRYLLGDPRRVDQDDLFERQVSLECKRQGQFQYDGPAKRMTDEADSRQTSITQERHDYLNVVVNGVP